MTWRLSLSINDFETDQFKFVKLCFPLILSHCHGIQWRFIIINTSRPIQISHSTDAIFKCIFLIENICISIKISLKFVPEDLINNISSLVQTMAWRRPGDKPLSEPMMISLLTQHSPQLRHSASTRKGTEFTAFNSTCQKRIDTYLNFTLLQVLRYCKEMDTRLMSVALVLTAQFGKLFFLYFYTLIPA